jgi:hypothetical protein
MPLKSLPRQMVLNYFFLVRRELDFFALFTFGLSFSGLGDVLNAPFSAASKRARASFSEYSSCFLGVETMTTCSSSDNLRPIRHFENGGSGSSGVRV